ncbi:MAG: DinB family protein [Bacteroidota bacterium]
MDHSLLAEEFKARAIHHCQWNLERINRCIALVDEEELWLRHNENSLSLGNQLLHLAGNLRQWIVHSLGGLPDERERSAEFAAEGGIDKASLMKRLESVVGSCVTAIEGLGEAELLRIRDVQAYTLSGAAALLHAVEHFSYHTGQIIQLTKLIKNQSLDFYGGQALDTTN